MAYITLHYGTIFGKGDASDWIEWDVYASDDEVAIHDRDVLLRKNPNDDDRLKNCLSRAYEEIEDEEIENGISNDDEYTMECTGRMPVDPDEINDLVADRDEYTLEFFGLQDCSEEELDDWDANDLDELPDICDFDSDFVSNSPFDMGWSLNVEFYNPEDNYLKADEAEATIRTLIDEKAFDDLKDYVERCKGDFAWNDKTDLEALAQQICKELGVE